LQGVANGELRQRPDRELAARDMPDVQFGAIVVARGVRHREIPAIAVGHDHLQILSCLERCSQTDREAQVYERDVFGGPRQPEDRGGDDLAAEDVDALEPFGANGQIGARMGAAHQCRAVAWRPATAAALLDLAAEKGSLAGVARALPARRRHGVSGALRDIEHEFARFARKSGLAAGDADGECHAAPVTDSALLIAAMPAGYRNASCRRPRCVRATWVRRRSA